MSFFENLEKSTLVNSNCICNSSLYPSILDLLFSLMKTIKYVLFYSEKKN